MKKWLLLFLFFVNVSHAQYRYSIWNNKAQKLCALALKRIQEPYKPMASTLTPFEKGAEVDDFRLVGIRAKKEEALRIIDSFPSIDKLLAKKWYEKSYSEDKGRSFELSVFFPKVVQMPFVFNRRNGANCFGVALGWFELSNEEFYWDPKTFSKILKKHFSKIKEGEALTPETLIVWRFSDNLEPLHAAVLLDRNVLWHRAGANPATFSFLEKAINKYGGREGGPDDSVIEFYRKKKVN